MKLRLQTKYSLTIIVFIMSIILILSGILLLKFNDSMHEIKDTSSDLMADDLMNQLKKRGEIMVRFLAESLVNPLYKYDMETMYEILRAAKDQGDIQYVYVIDPGGKVIHDGTKKLLLFGSTAVDEASIEPYKLKAPSVHIKTEMMEVTAPIILGGNTLGAVMIGIGLDGIKNDISLMNYRLDIIGRSNLKENLVATALIAIGVYFFGAVLAAFIGRRLGRPLVDLRDAAMGVAKGDMTRLVNVETEDELGELSDTFNLMVLELEKKTVSKEYVDNIIENMNDILVVLSPELVIQTVNKAACKLLMYSKDELVGRHVSIFFPKAGEILKKIGKDRSYDKKPITDIDTIYLARDGREINVLCSATVMHDFERNMSGIVCVGLDISKRKKFEAQLEKQAFYDPLTNLPNRAHFTKQLDSAIDHMHHHNDYLFAVLFMDLDRFKIVNDSLGHVTGDNLLIHVARRLEECIRGNDSIARFGGDEFALLLDDIQDVNDATHIADRIQNELSFPFHLDANEVYTTVSIGIALSLSDYKSGQEILRDADTAMYRAKSHGRARYELFDTDMRFHVMKMIQLEADLRRAVQKKEFELFYQPLVSVNKGNIIGSEALVRWNHAKHGWISPSEFIPIAEETGLIFEIGEWVLQTACLQNREWHDSGYKSLFVNVNFSSRQFHHKNLLKVIERTLEVTDLPPRYLNVEITESIAMEEHSVAIFKALSKKGIRTSIDDFGTGYSSLGSLKLFPIDALKIHKSFVRDINKNPDVEAIIRAIIAMAHALKIRVIAEGVETSEQLEFLKAVDCDEMQGYLFSRPVDSQKFTKILEREKGDPSRSNIYYLK